MGSINSITRGKHKKALSVSESSREQVAEVTVDLEARIKVELQETIRGTLAAR